MRTPDGRRAERHIGRTQNAQSGIREIAVRILERRIEPIDAVRELGRVAPACGRRCFVRATLYGAIGHGTDLMRYEAIELGSGQWWVRRRGSHERGTGDTLANAARDLGANLQAGTGAPEEEQTAKRSPYEVRYLKVGDETEYGVWRRSNGRWICVRKCESVKDGRATITTQSDQLDAWWEQWRRIPETRRARNAPRTPPGHNGTSDPETFSRRFGFRGVQFGNWVEDDRRRTDLDDTAQALTDLAQVLGWPVRTLSLGTGLALAFGARGKGGARRVRAHYEPDRRVIAISKPLGPGTLAHEWFHALDHNVGATAEGRADYATMNGTRGPAVDGLGEALRIYGHALHTMPFARRAAKLDRRRPRGKPYWSTTIELAARAFEAWTLTKLAALGIRNDYLVNYVGSDQWEGDPRLDQQYPYPYGEELMTLDPLLEQVAATGSATRRWELQNTA